MTMQSVLNRLKNFILLIITAVISISYYVAIKSYDLVGVISVTLVLYFVLLFVLPILRGGE